MTCATLSHPTSFAGPDFRGGCRDLRAAGELLQPGSVSGVLRGPPNPRGSGRIGLGRQPSGLGRRGGKLVRAADNSPCTAESAASRKLRRSGLRPIRPGPVAAAAGCPPGSAARDVREAGRRRRCGPRSPRRDAVAAIRQVARKSPGPGVPPRLPRDACTQRRRPARRLHRSTPGPSAGRPHPQVFDKALGQEADTGQGQADRP